MGSNNYIVDGIPTSTSSGEVTFIPSVEAVSDAKVQANTYDSEVGRTGGGAFNTSMKSGSNAYHGVLYGMTQLGSGAYLSSPFSGGTNGSIVQPSQNSLGLLTSIGSTVSVIDFKRRFPFVEQYSLDIQHELPWATTIKVAYSGAPAQNFPLAVNINQLPNSQFAALAANPVDQSTNSLTTKSVLGSDCFEWDDELCDRRYYKLGDDTAGAAASAVPAIFDGDAFEECGLLAL